MKNIILTILVIFFCNSAFSQLLVRHSIVDPKPANALDLRYYSKKKGVEAAAEIFGFNIGLWSVDRFILKGDYAYINFKTIKANFQNAFVWDNDQLSTNMFAHPYTGGLYFNAARSNGYNYWASFGFAASGSLMWEMCMENEYPSINDLLATSIGGSAMGEITYRSSDLVLDDRKRGSSRFGSELACACIAPTRELTRILNGDAWRVRQTSGRQFGTPDISIDVAAGVRVMHLKDQTLDKGIGLTTQVLIAYGDKFEADNTKPFDQFSIQARLNAQKGQPILGQINIIGRIAAAELINTDKDFLSFGAYQHFDYYDSDTISAVSNIIPYKLATPAAVGVGLIYQDKRLKNWNFDSYLHLNAIILGASLSDHYLVDNRNYNMGSGFGAKAGFNIAYKDKVGLSWTYEGYRIYTWKGYPEGMNLSDLTSNEIDVQGDKSKAYFDTSTLALSAKLAKNWYMTYQFNWHGRTTHYAYFDDVKSFTNESMLLLSYKF